MKRLQICVLSLGFAVAALAACQPVGPQTGKDVAPGSSKPFGERRGWQVSVIEATSAVPMHCRGYKPGVVGLSLSFFGGREESGFVVGGIAAKAAAGGADRLTLRFDSGENRVFDARVVSGGALEVRFPTAAYDETLEPVIHARSATLSAQTAGAIGSVDLVGSSWAINATDECRRINAKK